MKAIKFNESELDFLRNHYELELSDAENYVTDIKNILNKLGVSIDKTVKEKPAITEGKKRGRKKKEKAAKKSAAKSKTKAATPAAVSPVTEKTAKPE